MRPRAVVNLNHGRDLACACGAVEHTVELVGSGESVEHFTGAPARRRAVLGSRSTPRAVHFDQNVTHQLVIGNAKTGGVARTAHSAASSWGTPTTMVNAPGQNRSLSPLSLGGPVEHRGVRFGSQRITRSGVPSSCRRRLSSKILWTAWG